MLKIQPYTAVTAVFPRPYYGSNRNVTRTVWEHGWAWPVRDPYRIYGPYTRTNTVTVVSPTPSALDNRALPIGMVIPLGAISCDCQGAVRET